MKINIVWSESFMNGIPLTDIENILNSTIDDFVEGEVLGVELKEYVGGNRFWIYWH